MSTPKYVYFIKPVGMDGPIKIGCSSKPEKRLLALSAWSPFVLEIIGTAPGGHTDEAFLHGRFVKQHSHREWFHSSPLLRHTIERILAGADFHAACAEIPKAGSIRNQRRRLVTPERQIFLDYGAKIRKAIPRSNKQGSFYAPPDVRSIMENWRGDYQHRKPVTPNAQEIARLDEFLSDPDRHAVFLEWRPAQGHEAALAEAFAKQRVAMLGAAQ